MPRSDKDNGDSKTIYIGIDPGASGGVAVTNEMTSSGIKMPATEADVWGAIRFYGQRQVPAVAVIERVNGFIGKDQPGSAMFKFGQSYGGLRMALIAAGIPFEEVSPQTWQKEFALKKGKAETRTQWKNRLKAKAQQLFPGVAVTLATADALLIAEYCRRKHQRG